VTAANSHFVELAPGSAPPQPPATVVIATRDRRDELRTALQSVLRQSVPLEVLVVDDASTDGTAEMVQSDFPQVRLFRGEFPIGYAVGRHFAAIAARGPIVFSLDDDAVFAAETTVEETLADFASERVGAVAIPIVDEGPLAPAAPPAYTPGLVLFSFRGAAYAIRRDVFLAAGGYLRSPLVAGGYRTSIVRQGEERDLAIRMLATGYVIRAGAARVPVVHRPSSQRDVAGMDYYGRRNDVLYGWLNVPAAALPAYWLRMIAKGLAIGLRVRRPARMVRGLAGGAKACWQHRTERSPVPTAVYRLSRELRRGGATLEHVEPRLPPMKAVTTA